MVCYTCGSDTLVKNSRPLARSNQVWRRRHCPACDITYTTTESIDFSKSFVVRGVKIPGLVAFDEYRLLFSLHKSLAHRSSAQRDASELCRTIMHKAAQAADNGIIEGRTIIQITSVALTRFDSLAAQHYQALHKL